MIDPSVNARNVFYTAGCMTIIVGILHHSMFDRVVWALFGVALLVAADKIKDVEKAKKKSADETETRIRMQMAVEFEQSLDQRYNFFMSNMASTVETIVDRCLSRMSTYVKDISPTRGTELRVVADEAEIKQ